MSMITGDWQEALSGEFKKDYYKKLYTFVKDEYNRCVVYPPADDIFNAFHFTPLKDVKVLILGTGPLSRGSIRHMVLVFRYFRVIRYLSRSRIYIRSFRMTWDVIIRIMDILRSGQTRVYLC